MDIHRCRFVHYQPSSINSVAFSHTSDPKQNAPRDLRLALGRENGDIELWNPNRGDWVQERVFRSGVDRIVEQIHWTQSLIVSDEEVPQLPVQKGPLRLFSSGGSTAITEWDLEKGVPRRHVDGNAGDIWCFAPQPQWTEPQIRNRYSDVQAVPSQQLVAGTTDGTIILFSTVDDELQFDRVLIRPTSKKSRCLCITWKDRNTVVAGFEESVIRIIDVKNRQIIRNLSIGKARDVAKPLVWAVKCLPNGTILSGDSSGELKIWDSQNYSLVQRLKTHNADILDITTNAAGTTILTCGVDRRTVAYAPQSGAASAKTQRWNEIRHRRFHEHDVKTMATFESKKFSMVVSGGIDTVPIVIPMKNWNSEYHRSLPYLPQKPQMSVSALSRLILTWWSKDLYLWHLPPRYADHADLGSEAEDHGIHKLLAHIELGGENNLTSAMISNNGTMIVASTNSGVKLFQIRRVNSSKDPKQVKTRSIDLPHFIANQGASAVGFSPDNKWLYAIRLNNVIMMVKIRPGLSLKEELTIHNTPVKLDRGARGRQTSRQSALGTYPRVITQVAFSSDSRILAVGDLSGQINTWILEGHETENSDKTADNRHRSPGQHSSDDDDDDDDGSDSDSDSDDETNSRVIHGQKWIRNPSGFHLPSLESAVLTMTFKPSKASPLLPHQIRGNEGLHATRQNQHPIAPEYPPPEAGMLVAVAANHMIVEFDVLNCRLSDWSRRNPRSSLPEDFRVIKDRVMGMWIDSRPDSNIERLWLHGTSFIYMFDMKTDFQDSGESAKTSLVKVGQLGQHTLEAPQDHTLVQRKQEVDTENQPRKKRKLTSGAGDEMKEEQKYQTQIQILKDGNEEEMEGVEMDNAQSSPARSSSYGDDTDMTSDDDEGYENSLVVQRRDQDKNSDAITQSTVKEAGPASWHTFQYRGIYGACLIDNKGAIQLDEKDANLPEVVIVERPMFDVDLVPRFTGNEW